MTSQSTSSNSYTNLATSGPAITLTVPPSGRVLVSVTSGMTGGTGSTSCFMSFVVSGGSALAASDARALILTNNNLQQASASFIVALTPSTSATFTAQYRASASTCTFVSRFDLGDSAALAGGATRPREARGSSPTGGSAREILVSHGQTQRGVLSAPPRLRPIALPASAAADAEST